VTGVMAGSRVLHFSLTISPHLTQVPQLWHLSEIEWHGYEADLLSPGTLLLNRLWREDKSFEIFKLLDLAYSIMTHSTDHRVKEIRENRIT